MGNQRRCAWQVVVPRAFWAPCHLTRKLLNLQSGPCQPPEGFGDGTLSISEPGERGGVLLRGLGLEDGLVDDENNKESNSEMIEGVRARKGESSR